jgi:hypothetical protein
MGKQINLTLLSTGQTYSVNTDQIIEVVPLGSTDSTVKIFKEIHNSNSYQLIEVDQAPSAIVSLAGGDIASFTSVGLPNTVVLTTFDIDNASGAFTVGETVRVGANTLAEVASATDDSMSLINVRNGLIANNDVITGTVSGETADVNQATILYGFGTAVLGATFAYDNASGAFTNGETVTIGSQSATVVSTGGGSMVVTNLTGAIADNDVITGLTSTETADVNDTTFAFTYSGGQTATRYLNVYRIKSAVGINLANVNRMAYDNSGIIQEAIMVSDSITTINAAINAAYDNVSLSANNTWTGTQTFSNAAGVTTNTITERTAAAGITIDTDTLIKDGGVSNAAGTIFADFMPILAQNNVTAGTGGAIAITNYLTTINTDAGGDAFTLANATQIGQLKKILLVVDGGGDAVITPTALSGGTTITMGDAADYVILKWTGAAWICVENFGCAIA